MALFALRYQYVGIIVCWEIKLHYCVSFSCLINNDGWLLFSSPPATILSSSPCKLEMREEIKGGEWGTSSDTSPEVGVAEVSLSDQGGETANSIRIDTLKVNMPLFINWYIFWQTYTVHVEWLMDKGKPDRGLYCDFIKCGWFKLQHITNRTRLMTNTLENTTWLRVWCLFFQQNVWASSSDMFYSNTNWSDRYKYETFANNNRWKVSRNMVMKGLHIINS